MAALYCSNLSLAAVNLLPALPMDGGRVLCCVLSHALPRLVCVRLVSALGVLTGLCITALGVYFWATGSLNPHNFAHGKLYDFRLCQALPLSPALHYARHADKKAGNFAPGQHAGAGTAVYGARSVGDAIAGMDARSYNLLYVLDDDMRLLGTVGEGELMDYALCRGSGAKLADITKSPRAFDPSKR